MSLTVTDLTMENWSAIDDAWRSQLPSNEIPPSKQLMKKVIGFHFNGRKSIHITFEDCNVVPSYLGALRTLKKLDLSANFLKEIPEALCCLKNLTELNVSINNITRLPENISMMSRLKILEADFNQLTYLPDTLSALTRLQKLCLYSNKALVNIPFKTLMSLPSLKHITVSETAIPDEQRRQLEKRFPYHSCSKIS